MLFEKNKYSQNNTVHWLAISDLMAGLMVVFLLISVVSPKQTGSSTSTSTSTSSTTTTTTTSSKVIANVSDDFQQNQLAIYDALTEEFGSELNKWKASIDKDTLSFNFQSPEKLFIYSTTELTPFFRETLTDFFPRYLDVLKPYQNIVNEIYIEGHTSTYWNQTATEEEAYFENLHLSQVRASQMLRFIYSLDKDERSWVKENILAIGFSSAHAIKIKGVENTYLSRRVSFRARLNVNKLLSGKNEVND